LAFAKQEHAPRFTFELAPPPRFQPTLEFNQGLSSTKADFNQGFGSAKARADG
jgi:hypothetical protein